MLGMKLNWCEISSGLTCIWTVHPSLCPSAITCPSHCHILLHNYWAKFNQIWIGTKHSWVKRKSENTLTTYTGSMLTKLRTKSPLVHEVNSRLLFKWKATSLSRKENIDFKFSLLLYDHTFAPASSLPWNVSDVIHGPLVRKYGTNRKLIRRLFDNCETKNILSSKTRNKCKHKKIENIFIFISSNIWYRRLEYI